MIKAAKKFLDNSIMEQFYRVQEENAEETEAYFQAKYGKAGKQAFGMELIDGQTVRQTLLEIMFTKEEIERLQWLVIKKNEARGYLDEINSGVGVLREEGLL